MKRLSLLLLLLAAAAHANGPDIANWSITVKGGPAFPVMGEFSEGAAETTSTTTENGEVVTTGNSANFLPLDWDDAYDNFLDFAVEVDFWESETRSLYLGVSHTRADGKSAILGTFNGREVRASFSDYSDTGFYAGFRWGLGHSDWIKSLVSIQAGAAVVDSIEAGVTNLDGLSKVGFYERTTVFSGGIFLSAVLTPLDFLEVGIESGLEYQTGPDGDNSQLDVLGVGNVSAGGDLGLVPVRILATIKF